MPKNHRSTQRAYGANHRLRTRQVRMYPVYARKTANPEVVLGETPICYIDRATRDVWLDQGAVTSYTRGSMVRLTINLPPRPQPSVSMSGVSDGVAMGRKFARACLAAWTPRDIARPVPQWAPYGASA